MTQPAQSTPADVTLSVAQAAFAELAKAASAAATATLATGTQLDATTASALSLASQIAALPLVTPTPPPTPVSPPAPAGQPSAALTGPTNRSVLTAHAGSITTTAAGQTIKNLAITGSVFVKHPGVTISNCTIDANNGTYGVEVITPSGTASSTTGPSVTITDTEITNAASGAIFGSNWTAQRVQIHEMGSDATDGAWNCKLLDSWIYNIGKSAGSHADGFQSVGGQNIVIMGNYFQLPWHSTANGTKYQCNSCIFLEPSTNPIANVTIDGNWLDGGNYTIYAAGTSKVAVTNNKFGASYQYGLVYEGQSTVAAWTGNTLLATGAAA